MKKNLQLYFYLVFFSTFYSIALPAQDRILGKWTNESKDIVLEIYKEGNTFFGKIAWLKDEVVTQAESRTNRPQSAKRILCGLDILANMSYKEENLWENGQLYDFRTNRTQNCQLWLDKDDPNLLYIKTYNLIALLGTTTVWQRPANTHPVYTTRYSSPR